MAGCWNQVGENIIGSKGTSQPNRQIILGADRWRYRAEGTPRSSTQIEHDILFDAIVNNKPITNSTAENGAKSTMTAILGRMACYSGQMLEWDAALNGQNNLFPDKLAWDAMPKVLPDANGYYPRAMPGQTQVL
jgi:hypothetical protein